MSPTWLKGIAMTGPQTSKLSVKTIFPQLNAHCLLAGHRLILSLLA